MIYRKNSPSFVCLKTVAFLLFLGVILSCSTSSQKEEDQHLEPLPITHAKGFEVWQGPGFKIIEVKQAFSGQHDVFRYLVLEQADVPYEASAYDAVVYPGIERIVLTSTTQVPHLDLLGISDRMKGFPNTDLISSETMRKRIDAGEVTDLGKGAQANFELMVDLEPDLVIVSTTGEDLSQLALLKNAGIAVVINGEYTEQDPLGRAEWIKFTGALTGKLEESIEIFEEIENDYHSLKTEVSNTKLNDKPTVISGVMYNDIWYAPAGDNWGALFLKDAGSEYIFQDKTGTGSLQMNYEYVLDEAMDADIWIGAADFKDLKTMGQADPRYLNFKAYQNGEVYTFTNKRGAKGGIEYFELGYMRPDIILKDLTSIFHPELLPDYIPYFYEKLN